MEKTKTIILNFYYKVRMGYTDSWFKKKIMIPILEYHLFPEFRKRTFPIKKIFKWSTISSVVYFIAAVIINNFVLMDSLKDKDYELKNSYSEISNLYNNAKTVVYDECMDSVKNSEDYVRFLIYSKSGIIVPKNVPATHLEAIRKNAEKTGIPLSIYVRVIYHESGFDSSATNPSSSASGYMQLTSSTFKHFYDVLSLKGGNTAINNLICGSTLLKQNHEYWYKRMNDQEKAWQMALACYAIGDSLPRILGKVPESAQNFVNYVMNK